MIDIGAEIIGVIFQGIEFVLGNVEEGRQIFFRAVVVADFCRVLDIAAPLLDILEEGREQTAVVGVLQICSGGVRNSYVVPRSFWTTCAGGICLKEIFNVAEFNNCRVLVIFSLDAF